MKKLLVILAGVLVLAGVAVGGKYLPQRVQGPGTSVQNQNKIILNEENVVIDVAENVSPSVVTVSINKTQIYRTPSYNFDPFSDPFGFFRQPDSGTTQQRQIEQDIGSGFVISAEGLIVTNKHVVSDTEATYKVITKDDKNYDVQKIYRDPVNDIAILKINPSTGSGLKPVEMGDSSKLKVGQFVIAIGTALGEFRHTVTTGVVSGLGRGITAGSSLEGAVEKLDNVIQTDAAINPGNSGGPLLNSAGQVIGVNTAVSAQGQNIGFAIPINVVSETIDNFNKTGQFNRPYIGVRYRIIDLKTAMQYEIPQGAYVQQIITGSPAEKAGIKDGDVIVKIEGQKLASDENGLSKAIETKKVGDKIKVELWRDGQTQEVTVILEEAK